MHTLRCDRGQVHLGKLRPKDSKNLERREGWSPGKQVGSEC